MFETEREREGESERGRRASERARERKRERENSELYHSRIEILGGCLFLQYVLANLHANTYTTTASKHVDYHDTMMKVTMIIYW